MKKVICSLLLFLSIFSLDIVEVKAENIDISRTSSLSVTYQYDNILLSDAGVSLYYLASIDEGYNYKFIDEYQDVAFDTTDISASDLTFQAEVIERYIKDNKLQANRVLKTNQNGVANFSSLVPGLYLLIVDSKVVDNYQYNVSPTIINIPTFENGNYQYDVQINLKTQRDKLNEEITPPGENDNESLGSVPNTIDNIYFYIILLIMSIIIIFGVVIYISKKKGEKKWKKEKKYY